MAERKDLFGARPVCTDNCSAHIRILAAIVTGIHVHPNLHRTALEQLMKVLLRARGDGETYQRRVAFVKAPAFVSEGIDPVPLIQQSRVSGTLANHAERARFG